MKKYVDILRKTSFFNNMRHLDLCDTPVWFTIRKSNSYFDANELTFNDSR